MSGVGASRTWFGLEVQNPTSVPATLRFVRALSATNARIIQARVLDREDAGGSGVGVLSFPVGGSEGAAIERARPVDGFVLPAHSRGRYQLIVLVEPIPTGVPAVLRQTDIGYTALGLHHGFRSDAVLCIGASSIRSCH